jgi:hypothetical protein
MFDQLPPDLASFAVNDFIKLVNTGQLYAQTAAIFKNASTAAKSRIVEQLKTVNLITRQDFARLLRDNGLEVDIPGVEVPARPWQY